VNEVKESAVHVKSAYCAVCFQLSGVMHEGCLLFVYQIAIILFDREAGGNTYLLVSRGIPG
jgi:hypothetical protein